jgi:exonuclease SbcC
MLDSITLALYNQIPRSGKLSKKSIQEFGTLITRGTDECLVELDFQVNGKTYRSKWGISRARTGNLRDYHMELSFLNEKEEWELFDLKKSDIPAKNTELTGLNYDQFVKSILLSQGEFAKFLKAPQNERSELLEKITGTEIYRQIGKAAYERWKKEEEELKRIQLRIEHIELLSEEEKEKLTEELQKLRKDSEELKKLMTLLDDQLKVKEEIKKQTSQQEKIKASLEELTKEQEEFSPELERLKQHKQILPLQADIRELQSNQRENKNLLEALVQLEKDIQTQEVKNEECSKVLRENQQKHESLQKEFSDWEPKWTACLQLDEQMKSESKREDELKVDLEKKSKEILKNDEERKQLQ